ncbi:LysR substrate-binding domain-containing protein [Teichococcus wenyumeiae]|uniref:LysR substrate-binding domain-containing protein n=1 Tax=Teichococcus wenyumeiae TaxID=2478470 RepID=UPI001F3AC7E2|nr:LysR substrate-binding domain-containing protein [Pseudoroseomonas wenyumeiae]
MDREVHGTLRANNGETVRHMALLGLGLTRLGEFHVRADLEARRLVSVLDNAITDTEAVHALYLGRERMPRRMRPSWTS